MARIRMEGLDELIRALEDAENVDEIAEEMLVEGGHTLQVNVRSEIMGAADGGYATGQLMNSVIPDMPKKNAFGYCAEVHPVGIDSKGVRNGEKWGYLEHGNGGSQEPRPFEEKTVKRSEIECMEIMQEAYNRHMKL